MQRADPSSAMLGRLGGALAAVIFVPIAITSLANEGVSPRPAIAPAGQITVGAGAPVSANVYGTLAATIATFAAARIPRFHDSFAQLSVVRLSSTDPGVAIDQKNQSARPPSTARPRLPIGCEPLGSVVSALGHIAGRCLT